jgi:hypothetical protein
MNRNKIQIGVALVLAIFYTLPWIALAEQSRGLEQAFRNGLIVKRIAFLFVSVFLTTILFFQYNLAWKSWLQDRVRIQAGINLLANALLVILVCIVLVKITDEFFPRETSRNYLFHYITRTSLIAFVSFLVCNLLGLVAKLEIEKLKSLTLEKQKVENELEVLKAQINPHFFFNSLTSLTVLIREDARKAMDFINHLSSAFRYILDKRQLSKVSLQDELAYLESYMFMMRQRFGESLQLNLQVEDTTLKKHVPQFALQLVVENAIKHNIISSQHPLTISISTSNDSILVRNNMQLKKSNIDGYGIGLQNLHYRYSLLQKKKVEIVQTDTYYEIKLPLL